LVGVIRIPSLGNVSWTGKRITTAKLTHTSVYSRTGTFRLYRSKLDSTDRSKNGSAFLDTSGGYTDIASGGGNNVDSHTASLSSANITWLLTQLQAGYTCFCIYYDETAPTTDGSFSTHYAAASAWSFEITYEPQTYTVTYNKGSSGTGTNTTDTKTYGTALTLKGAVFTRTNYEMDGWSTTDGGAKVYNLGGSYTANAAVTLYPHWKATVSTVTAPNGTLGSALTITISRALSTYTHRLRYKYGSASGTIATNVATSRSWTPPVSLASQFTAATSGTCTIYCDTYDANSNLVGTSSTNITLSIPSSVKVTVDTVTLAETVASVASKFGSFVQNKSKLSVTVAVDTSDAYGATVASYSISINGQTLTTNGAVTSAITNYGTLSYSVTVKDSRGRTDTYTGTYNVLAYTAPTVSETAQRNGSDNTQIDVAYSWNISSLNNLNDKSIVVRYKLSSASTYTTAQTITPTEYSGNGTYSLTGLQAAEQYDVRVSVTDYFTTVNANTEVAAVGKRLLVASSTDMTIDLHGEQNNADGKDHERFPIQFHDQIVTSLGDLSQTGRFVQHNPSAVSVDTSAWTNVAQLALTEGVWLLFYTAAFAANSAGRRQSIIATAADSTSPINYMVRDSENAVVDAMTYLDSVDVRTVSSSGATYYLNVWHNAGTALSTIGRLYAIRIC